MTTIYLKRRSLPARIRIAPRLFLRFYRIVHGLPITQRIRFACWQTWQMIKGF
ncbi:hypothetical protein [Thiobacillus sp.]|uniref:hypothetical protein n=1 Tax=Thiobacillus sp. TaxID=924 RepID=UPI00185787CB|nr:hypothetical protein [Thiobacillus sp.]MBC2731372.1 hypothetical protein [Thiobacillus sp.]MBC2740109.1 hypothetical protein [Thiobacillus sp.]MBC2758321.1 hypothetical protein [Thiobacillus sp.]